MRISTHQIQQQSVNAMVEQQAKVSKTQLQLATGRRIQSPADDPAGAKLALDLEQIIGQTRQYQRNSDAAEARLTVEESTLGSVVELYQRARELTVQALNDTQSPENRAAIAGEVRQVLDTVFSLANTKDANDEYLFSGFRTQDRPFSDDGAGGYTYNGDQGRRHLQIGASRQVAVGDAGSEIFVNVSGVAKDAFSVLYDLATDLEADNPAGTSLDEIDAVMNNVLRVQARIGARLNAVDSQRDVNAQQVLQFEQTKANVEGLDYAEAVSRLNLEMTGLQAAQQSYVRIQGLSLFNFLR